MENITIIVPFWNGHKYIERLLSSIPSSLPVIVVDDCSDEPLNLDNSIRMPERGYFSGAVNYGVERCNTDVLILNQDAVLNGTQWIDLIADKRDEYAAIGDGVMRHPAWPHGYIQGTFMFIRRDAWKTVGQFNAKDYPLWGSTCEWQLRACRAGYRALPMDDVPGLVHGKGRRFIDENGVKRRQRFGDSITEAMRRERDKFHAFTRTPPMISVIVPCYNYGRYLHDAVNSLVGGDTCLGVMEGQTFQSFEIIIIDDASTDNSWEIAQSLHNRWKGIRAMRMPHNVGLPVVENHAIKRAFGEYIHILSADDMRESWCLETLLRACQENEHSVSYGDIRILKDGKRGKKLRLPDYDFEKVLHKNPMPAGIMYPKRAWKLVGGYPESMTYGREDWAFNIALGANGWCGVHVGDSGNLYRREGQNRSLLTSNVHKGEIAPTGSQDWRPYFKEQLRELYPTLYRGERPMGCCGGARRTPAALAAGTARATAQADLPGAAGMVVIEYIGVKDSIGTYWGDVTKTPYRFGGKRKRGYIDVRDFDGFMNVAEGRRTVFKEYIAPKAKKKVVPVEIKPEPVEVVPENDANLTSLPGVGESTAEKLQANGFNTIADVAKATIEQLSEFMSKHKAKRLIEAANA